MIADITLQAEPWNQQLSEPPRIQMRMRPPRQAQRCQNGRSDFKDIHKPHVCHLSVQNQIIVIFNR